MSALAFGGSDGRFAWADGAPPDVAGFSATGGSNEKDGAADADDAEEAGDADEAEDDDEADAAFGLAAAACDMPAWASEFMLVLMVCSAASVALCTSSACIVLRSMLILTFSQDSTAFRSVICLLTSSTDREGIAIPGIFMPPHRFLTNSRVSVIAPTPGMPDILDSAMLVSTS